MPKNFEQPTTNNELRLDWSDLAFGSKSSVDRLDATFIAAPREISEKRFIQLVKGHLPKSNIILGIAKEDYIEGFEDQPQFKTLKLDSVENIITKVNKAATKNKIYTLEYFQRELKYILEKLKFKKVIFINGSWHKVFHTREEFYILHKNKIEYELISPFCDEVEAIAYVGKFPSLRGGRGSDGVFKIQNQKIPTLGKVRDIYSTSEIFEMLEKVKQKSFATDWQTSAILAKKSGNKYKILEYAHNAVIPYETYAMHFGSSKEKNFSPPNDLNHFDTNHAEVELLIKAQKKKLDLKGTTLFINLLPCPTCCKMLCKTDIEEIVYSLDHSDGYAVKMFEKAGKLVTRI